MTQEEWDAEKKELKKIESTNIPENFEKYVEHLLSLSDGEGHSSPAKVKEVSAELLKLAKLEQKSTWSEEDEKAINDIMWIIEAYRKNGFNETHIQMADNSENWLKSLRPQKPWKPSMAQLNALTSAIKKVHKGNADILEGLKEKLMEL